MIAITKPAAATHSRAAAEKFLHVLEPAAFTFTFQFLGEGGRHYAETRHCSLDDTWSRIAEINTPEQGIGVFVTINETNGRGGRRREDIIRARALWVDADSPDQVRHCNELFQARSVAPSMSVRSSSGRAHHYWVCDDLGLDEFSELQAALARSCGTDPAVKDLPRVMRLPGTLHLKDPCKPQFVELEVNGAGYRWKARDLIDRLGLELGSRTGKHSRHNDLGLAPASQKLRELFNITTEPLNDLAAGLETNIEELRSAAAAIPPKALTSEPDWVRLAMGFAHGACIYEAQSEEIWEIFDELSRTAPGYDAIDNKRRWDRYVRDACSRTVPITIATVFDVANKNGWQGWSPPTVTPVGNSMSPLITSAPHDLSVSFSNVPHRQWLYGVDLVRGEITVVASPGGVGKSSLAVGVATSLVTGRPLLGEKVFGGPTAALYINAEDSRVEMTRRIWAFCQKHNLTERDIGKLVLLGADDWQTQRLSFLRSDRGNSILDESGFAHLESILDQFRPGVLVLDPLVALCGGGNINDNAAMSLVMRALKRLASKFDSAVLVLHHTRKGGDLSNAEAVGGAAAIVNLARRAIMAVPMSEAEATKLAVLPTERLSFFRAVEAKANLGPRSIDAQWYKLCSVTLPNPEPPTYMTGDRVQAVERVNFSALPKNSVDQQAIRRAIVDLLDRGKNIDGVFVPYSPATTGARNARALLADAFEAVRKTTASREWSDQDLEVIIPRELNGLKKEGIIFEDEIKEGRFRRGRALRVDKLRVPWCSDSGESVGEVDVEDAEGTLHQFDARWSMIWSINDQLP